MSVKKSAIKFPCTRLLLVALLVSLGGSFHFGYQLTMTNPCQDSFLHFLDDSFYSRFSWHLTRTQLETGSFELYAGSRLLIGFSLGLSLGLGAIYLTECSPKNCRGVISMTLGVMVQLGTVVGSVVAMPQMLCNSTGWWRIYGVELVILLFVLTVLLFVHESPGFLILREDDQAARHSIQFFHNSSTASEVENSLKEMKENMKVKTKSVTMLQLKAFDRRGTIAGCAVAFAMAFSGIVVINAFAVEIFRSIGLSLFDASVANVGLSVISLLSCIISSCIIDRFGRRRLLLLTVTILLFVNLSIVALMFAYQSYGYNWLGVCLITAISVFIFAFATGPGPLCFFITSEMVSRTILLTIFLPLKNALGSADAYLILFVVPLLCSIIFFYFGLPETKNKNVQEIEEEFTKLPKLVDIIEKYSGTSRTSQRTPESSATKVEL